MDSGDSNGYWDDNSLKSKSSRFGSTSLNAVEHYGPQMPFTVAECLMKSDNNGSVNLNVEDGWAWYVLHRKLLVWPVARSRGKIPPTVNTRELLLPLSNIPFTAQLVSVFHDPDANSTSCIGVSPCGRIRYWRVVGQYTPWIDTEINLPNEKVSQIIYLRNIGCVALTLSGSVVILKPRVNSVVINSLSNNWLCDVTSKMSSLIFGPNPSMVHNVLKLMHRPGKEFQELYVLAGTTLKKWNLQNSKNNLVFKIDLAPILSCEGNVTITDFQLSEVGVVVLYVLKSDCKYSLAEIPQVGTNDPANAFPLCSISKDDLARFSDTGRLPILSFFLLQSHALIYNKNHIGAVALGTNDRVEDWIELPGGHVFGGNKCGNGAIFFSVKNGFTLITPIRAINLLDEVSIFHPSGSSDSVSLIKASFMAFTRKNGALCQSVLDKLASHSDILKALVKVSLDLINAKSPRDPRWADESEFNFSCSLNIENQLSEKLAAHELFLDFVKKFNLGDINEPVGDTLELLEEHSDKIQATVQFRINENKYADLLNLTIFKTPESHIDSSLTAKDHFYRHVVYIGDGLRVLIDLVAKMNQLTSTVYLEKVKDTNEVLTDVVHSVIRRRESKGMSIPKWLTMVRPKGIFDSIIKLARLSYQLLIHSKNFQMTISTSFLALADLILYITRTSFSTNKYHSLRHCLIECFVQNQLFVQAKQLATKYEDFKFLVQICFATKDESSITKFMDVFKNCEFFDEVFRWLLVKGHHSKLIHLPIPPHQEHRLHSFLFSHPRLNWLYCLEKNQNGKARSVLTKLSLSYTRDIVKKQRMLSMAKLMTLCEGKAEVAEINEQLESLKAQNMIPQEMTPQSGSFLPPIDVIKFLIDPSNVKSTEHHFSAALRQVSKLKGISKSQLYAEIWARAVLKDSWTKCFEVTPDSVQQLFFARVVSAVRNEVPLPSAQLVMEHELLSDERNNTFLIYVLRYVLECSK